MSLPTICSSSFLIYLPNFGPRYQSQQPIMSLPTIYSTSRLCYLPLFAPDTTLSTLLSVSPQYTVLHPSVTFPFWPQKSLSAHYYQSPHNIQFFTPLLPSPFWHQISLSAPYYQAPHNIQFFTPLLPSPLAPDITLSTLLCVSPQYTVLHSCVTFPFCPDITLSTLL